MNRVIEIVVLGCTYVLQYSNQRKGHLFYYRKLVSMNRVIDLEAGFRICTIP